MMRRKFRQKSGVIPLNGYAPQSPSKLSAVNPSKCGTAEFRKDIVRRKSVQVKRLKSKKMGYSGIP